MLKKHLVKFLNWGWILSVFFTLLVHDVSATEHRVALVIGNAKYIDKKLKNPINDSRGIYSKLKEMNFKDEDIIYRENLTSQDINQTLNDFLARIRPESIVVIYYAGHGLQLNDENFFPMVDAQIKKEEDVPKFSLKFSTLLDKINNTNTKGINIIFLDACRNNIFKNSLKDKSSGLSRTNKPRKNYNHGTLIISATQPGAIADDGFEDNSPFTAALIKNINTPDLSINSLTTILVRDVKSNTFDQSPWQEGNLDKEYYFTKSIGISEPIKAPSPAISGINTLKENIPNFTKDCAQCPALIFIQGNKFQMGSNDGSGESWPKHEVNIQGFWLGKIEVTQHEWQQVMGSNPSTFKNCGPSCPVEEVNWDDALVYLGKLNEITGKKYRLPSEAEWEYAMRANSTTIYPWGDFISREYANYGKDVCCAGMVDGGDKWINTSPTKSFPANAYGLFDMAGNVKEWVADCWHSTYDNAPKDGSAWTSNCTNNIKVVRGGSWNDVAKTLLPYFRQKQNADMRRHNIGFRVARQ